MTRFAIKNHVLTFSVVVVLILSGIMAFNNMPRDDMPPFLIRFVSIVTTFPGASPERVENLVSDKIEKVVNEVPEVDYIASESRTGISIITVSIKESEYDLQPIFDDIRRKIQDTEPLLPQGTTVSFDDELGDVFGIILGLTADGYSYSEMKDLAEEMRDELIKLDDAAKVLITGYQDENIYVEFNNARLAELGLTVQMLQGIIASTNIVFPGGQMDLKERTIVLEPTGSYTDIDDLKQTIVASSGGDVIRLSDVAEITRQYEDPRQRITKINGTPGLAIAINMKDQGNIIRLGQDVDKMVSQFKEIYPWGVELQRVSSSDTVVQDKVNDFMENLIQAVAVVLVVMLLFMGFRTGLVVASLIPVTMVMTFLLMSIADIGLNQVTLASLIIALGMLVDNAIVITESIMDKMQNGESSVSAAIGAAKELNIPLLTSSLTTAAAFMAFYLADSVMGEIMGNIFLVVSFALLSSWFLSLTLIPLLCTYAIRVDTHHSDSGNNSKETLFQKFNKSYGRFLNASLNHPMVLITCIVILFAGALFLFKYLPFVFMPKSDRPLVTANIELPLGTRIERTASVIDEIEGFIITNLKTDASRPEGVITWSTYVGEGAPKYDLGYTPPESSPNAAHILMNTSSDAINDHVIQQLDQYIFNHYPEATYQVSRLLNGGGSVNPIAVRLSGDSFQDLYTIRDSVKAKLNSIEGSKNVSDNWGMQTKKILIRIHQIQAQMAGLTNEDIATSLKTTLSGTITGEFRDGDKVIPIIMRNDTAGDLTLSDLESINIYSQTTGKTVPLKQVADAEIQWQASRIIRRDLDRTVTITSDFQRGYTASEVVSRLEPWLEEQSKTWPRGMSWKLGGDAEESADAMNAVTSKLPFSMFIIILLLISQFNSIRKPVIILMTIPLGLIGVIPGLLFTGSYFGFMAFLGVISLSGVVINNAIVLLDRIKIEMDEFHRPVREAIVTAAHQRFRPILLTTATTSLGLLPLWFGGGIMWEPMAITIIFGLLFATVLTLVFIPVVYRVFFKD